MRNTNRLYLRWLLETPQMRIIGTLSTPMDARWSWVQRARVILAHYWTQPIWMDLDVLDVSGLKFGGGALYWICFVGHVFEIDVDGPLLVEFRVTSRWASLSIHLRVIPEVYCVLPPVNIVRLFFLISVESLVNIIPILLVTFSDIWVRGDIGGVAYWSETRLEITTINRVIHPPKRFRRHQRFTVCVFTDLWASLGQVWGLSCGPEGETRISRLILKVIYSHWLVTADSWWSLLIEGVIIFRVHIQ